MSSSSSSPPPAPCEDTDRAVNHDTTDSSTPTCHSSPPIYSLRPTRLSFMYYVRADARGYFHTYPALTGPFQSLEEAQHAIDSRHAQQCKMMCMKGLSGMEISIRRALYWPNGLRKNSAEALSFMKNLRPEVELVRALLDRYNEDNALSGDLAYELVKVVHCEPIHEGNGYSRRLYYHFNLVIRTKKGADDDSHARIDNLFFAEVACVDGETEESVLNSICMLRPDDNGKCIECDVDMKHPSDVEYKHGQPKIPMLGMYPGEWARAYTEELVDVYDEAKLKAQEARVRNEFKELYDTRSLRVQKYVVPARR